MVQDPKENPRDQQFRRFIEAARKQRRSDLNDIFEKAFLKVVKSKKQNARIAKPASAEVGPPAVQPGRPENGA